MFLDVSVSLKTFLGDAALLGWKHHPNVVKVVFHFILRGSIALQKIGVLIKKSLSFHTLQ